MTSWVLCIILENSLIILDLCFHKPRRYSVLAFAFLRIIFSNLSFIIMFKKKKKLLWWWLNIARDYSPVMVRDQDCNGCFSLWSSSTSSSHTRVGILLLTDHSATLIFPILWKMFKKKSNSNQFWPFYLIFKVVIKKKSGVFGYIKDGVWDTWLVLLGIFFRKGIFHIKFQQPSTLGEECELFLEFGGKFHSWRIGYNKSSIIKLRGCQCNLPFCSALPLCTSHLLRLEPYLALF